MKISIILLTILFTINIYTQSINWIDITNDFTLPQGVKLFHGKRSNPQLKAWYFEVDMNNPSIALRAYLSTASGGREGLVPFVQRVGAIAGINGGYFDVQTGASYSAVSYDDNLFSKNISSVVRDGKTYPITRSFFGITDTREMSIDWIYHFGNRVIDIHTFEAPIQNAVGTPGQLQSPAAGNRYYELMSGIGGGPTLVKNSVANITYNEEVFWGSGVGLTNNDPRTAIGYTSDNKVIMFVADGRQTISEGVSLIELANIMISLGCIEAMNLDGGGSTQMAVGNNLINKPEGGTFQRPVASILAIVHSDSTGFLPPNFFNHKIDTDDEECTLIGNNWIASNIAGYWGNSPSLITPKGNGEEYAKFKPVIPKESEYDLFAWWVAASNRCSDTPVFVHHKNGKDTVYINQKVNGTKWNFIGTYTFNEGNQNEIIISNAATEGDYIVADAIRLISYDSTLTSIIDNGKKSINTISDFHLYQNYPNPFNPITKIKFSIPQTHNPLLGGTRGRLTTLKVYDILGNEVATLFNEPKEPGIYEVEFSVGSSGNASNLSSGVYFYTLRAGEFISSKKMILLK